MRNAKQKRSLFLSVARLVKLGQRGWKIGPHIDQSETRAASILSHRLKSILDGPSARVGVRRYSAKYAATLRLDFNTKP